MKEGRFVLGTFRSERMRVLYRSRQNDRHSVMLVLVHIDIPPPQFHRETVGHDIWDCKDFLCLDNEHIFGGDQGYTPEIMDEILTTARDLEFEGNEDDIEELTMGHEDELTTEEL
ncbi:hypothetical protein TNCV_1270361 [Trichonephila clavipes]|nr:hypothetical protein TNCV_1270361 [Trichonephila clavipes]